MLPILTQERALIFRITHRDNIPGILRDGIHCRNTDVLDRNFVPIGNPQLIEKRRSRAVPHAPHGTLADYVPFYFTPRSIMMYNINTGHNNIRQRRNDEIIVLVSSLHKLNELEAPFLFTDRHASIAYAEFSNDITSLNLIDWPLLQRHDFRKDDLDKFERYQAEALIHKHCPVDALLGIACNNESAQKSLIAQRDAMGLSTPIRIRREFYF